MKYLYDDITQEIWKVFRKLRTEFGSRSGLSETEKRNVLQNELKQRNLCATKEVPVIHRHNGQKAGVGYMDLVVEGRVVVEVKDIRAIRETDLQQLEQYLKDSSLPVGVVLNFGFPEANLESEEDRKKIYRRIYLRENDPYLKG